MKGLVDTDNA